MDADGVALAAIQGLNEKLMEKDKELAALRDEKDAEIRRLREETAALRTALNRQSAAVETRLQALERGQRKTESAKLRRR